MDRLVIRGGVPLKGSISISGSKNSAVALMPAALLADSPVILDQVPQIQDVHTYRLLLENLGARVERTGSMLQIDPSKLGNQPLPNGLVKRLRASYYLMGVLLARFGEAIVGLPGGCALGPRPIDQHIKGFQALGAEVAFDDGCLRLVGKRLTGTRIYLDVVSVGATINLMLAAVLAKGTTILEHAAKEPEVVDLATLLNAMGARITGAGTDVIKIEGVKYLKGCRHDVIPDRVEAGTYLIAAAATGGEVCLENIIPEHLDAVLAKLREMGAQVEWDAERVQLVASGRTLRQVDVKTLPYPGFPTDLQQPFTVLLTQAEGISMVTDNIFASRFKHVEELLRMGASIQMEGRTAVVRGRTRLVGTRVQASDLRTGAAMVIAGLVAEGVTEVTNPEHLDRGYEQLEQKFAALGADMRRLSGQPAEREDSC
jgi:UDP-N-acetylglucosamine 1-carboxyvinyltransferase